MIGKQKTIKKEFTLSGIGLHTGCQVTMRFKPAPVNTGIHFVRTDCAGRPEIKAEPANIRNDTGVPRCTTIGRNGVVIHTVEHLMSVLSGINIANLIIELDAQELPGLDGSGKDFLEAIKKAGVIEQDAPIPYFKLREPVGVQGDDCSIYVVPADDFRIAYTLDYNHPVLRSQFFNTVINPATFEREIAPSRTFCLESEAAELREMGLGKGANRQNTLIVGKDGVEGNRTRFPDEFARHKILDLIGDLYLLGMPILGHVYAVRSGHRLNLRLLSRICDQIERERARGIVIDYDIGEKKEIDVNGIMKILPHRYPFLLVDRVIEIERGRKAVGIKNVTASDSYFQGHFPTKPIMPGVLMIEAMAQTAGVAVLTNESHHGKVAFFMAADKIKFRKVVVPGDQLLLEVEVVKDRPKIAQIRAQAKVNDDIVAEAEMVFSFTDASYLDG